MSKKYTNLEKCFVNTTPVTPFPTNSKKNE